MRIAQVLHEVVIPIKAKNLLFLRKSRAIVALPGMSGAWAG
jgi:hypothetical protein